MPQGLYFPGYSAADANPDIGDSAILQALAAIAPLTVVRGNNDRGSWAEQLAETALLEVGETAIYAIGLGAATQLFTLGFGGAAFGTGTVTHTAGTHTIGPINAPFTPQDALTIATHGGSIGTYDPSAFLTTSSRRTFLITRSAAVRPAPWSMKRAMEAGECLVVKSAPFDSCHCRA